MARYFEIVGDGGGGEATAGLLSHGSGLTFYLCMIVLSVSIISMVIFNCGDSNGKPSRWHGGGGGGGGSACGDGGGGGGGSACGGGGGSACGGGGGGGGCGGGGGGGGS